MPYMEYIFHLFHSNFISGRRDNFLNAIIFHIIKFTGLDWIALDEVSVRQYTS